MNRPLTHAFIQKASMGTITKASLSSNIPLLVLQSSFVIQIDNRAYDSSHELSATLHDLLSGFVSCSRSE